MELLTALIWTPTNGLVVLSVAALLTAARAVSPATFQRPVVARILPVLPILLCGAALWIPGLSGAPAGLGDRILLGVILGAVTAHSWKTIAQTVLGRDVRIEGPPPPPVLS